MLGVEVGTMNRSRWCHVGVVALVFVAGLGALAEDCVITVQPGESIQAAIDAASPGDVICLSPGEWVENLVIEKSITLRGIGANETVIRGLEDGLPVLGIESAEEIEVTIEALTVFGAKAGEPRTWQEGGIRVSRRAHVMISNATVKGNAGAGISIGGLVQITVSDSTVEGNGEDGISAWGSTQATVSGSTVEGNGRAGISIGNSAQITIFGSTVAGNRGAGIRIWDSARSAITDSLFMHNSQGIFISDSAVATIEDNVFRDNTRNDVILYARPYFDIDRVFTGHVIGSGNRGEANAAGDDCPDALWFLFTEEGGELDHRD